MKLPIKAVIGLSALLIIGLIGLLVFVAGQTNSSKQKLVESGEVRASSTALPTYPPPPTSSLKVVTKEVADEKPADLIKEIAATPTPNPTSTPTAVAIPVKTKPSNQVTGDDTAPVMGDFSFNLPFCFCFISHLFNYGYNSTKFFVKCQALFPTKFQAV